jgi:hypothetical protein
MYPQTKPFDANSIFEAVGGLHGEFVRLSIATCFMQLECLRQQAGGPAPQLVRRHDGLP